MITPASVDNNLTPVNSKTYSVNGLPASQLVIVLPGQTLLPGTQGSAAAAVSGTPTSQVAAVPFNATVLAVDTYYNIDAAFTGTESASLAMFSNTDPSVVLPSSTAFSAGQAIMSVTNNSFSLAHILRPSSSPTALTENNSASYVVASTPATRLIVILPGQTYVPGTANCVNGITGPPDDQTVGTPFIATIRAVDDFV